MMSSSARRRFHADTPVADIRCTPQGVASRPDAAHSAGGSSRVGRGQRLRFIGPPRRLSGRNGGSDNDDDDRSGLDPGAGGRRRCRVHLWHLRPIAGVATRDPARFHELHRLQSDRLFTRIASTSDGQSFAFTVDANAIADLVVRTTDHSVCGSGMCSGRIVHETSSLIYDSADPDLSRQFKLFDYSYVIVPAASTPAQHAWGYIGLYTAPHAEGPWSQGLKSLGWRSTADAISSQGATTLLSDIAPLADCVAFSEPAALVRAAATDIHLALGCVANVAGQPQARVVLLRSTDHAATFSYVGTLLTAADGSSIGSTTPGVQPADLFERGGDTYLIVSTIGSTTGPAQGRPSGYTSCTTILVRDLASAAIRRDAGGAPVVIRKLIAPGGLFAGACSFKPEFAAGYLVFQVTANPTRPDRIFRSGIRCP